MMPPKVKFSLTPYKEQLEVIVNPAIYRVVIIGRQAGKSWLAKYCALTESINENKTVLWIAPTMNQGRLHWRTVTSLIRQSGLPCKIREASKEIEFEGGGYFTMRSLGNDPEPLRGGSFDLVILDEAASYKNGEYIFNSIVQAMITATNGRILICTTPRGKNWVYNLFIKGIQHNAYYASWQLPSTVSPYQNKEMLEDIKQNVPQITWLEEYEAKFLDGSGGVFTSPKKCAKEERVQSAPREHEQYVVGLDWGHSFDATVAMVWERNTRRLVTGMRLIGEGAEGVLQKVVDFVKHWKPSWVVSEKNGLGEVYTDILKRRLRDICPVEVVHLDNATKVRLVDAFASAIEREQVSMPKEGLEPVVDILYHEMGDFIRINKENYHTYRAREGSHDDTIMATIYGLSKCKKFVYVGSDRSKDLKSPFRRR